MTGEGLMKHRRGVDIIVIGGGPAGLSSAVSAKRAGAGTVLLVERDHELGGILPQCIHTGFGLDEFKEELTGPEYASRWIHNAQEAGVEILINTMVLSITREKEVTIMGLETGITTIRAKAIILAMGCREKSRGALGIPGFRPAGIYTAGCAQRLVNIEGLMPGRRVLILGSGDIGLIMARRLTLEGAKVAAVCERMDKPGGLARNVQQCLNDFGIPLILSSTVVEIHGRKRVEAVTIGRVSPQNTIIQGSQERIECDTVLLSVGLIPENELSRDIRIEMDPSTGGPLVDQIRQTSLPGIFACGNVLKVYDLVDHVTEDAIATGKVAASWLLSGDGRFNSAVETGTENQQTVCRTAKNPMDNPTENPTDNPKGMPVGEPLQFPSREMICTICPKGCKIRSIKNPDDTWTFEGYTCKRGLQYAKDEVHNPKRTLTTSILQRIKVRENGRAYFQKRLVAVRSSQPVPLNQIPDIMEIIKHTVIRTSVSEGTAVLSNVLGTQADIIITRP